MNNDRCIVITGASGGIGAATALLLARRGCDLVLVARRRDALQETASLCGNRAVPITADAAVREEVRMVVETALGRFGRIDVWINNAGQGITRLPSQLDDDDIDEMMRVNVKAALYGMQETLPHFIARGRGHVINVSSMLGRIPYVIPRAAYSAAKHFLNALTASFRAEVQAAHPDIRYSLVSPGVVRTDFGLNALHGGPDSRAMPDGQSADEVAAVIAGVLDTRAADVYTRPGLRERVAEYYAGLGADPPGR
jgi:NADP-dependent 3-hydroxy acid dehydrogenase YdfG